MTWLQDLPIKRTLTLVILLTCSVVLLLASAVLAGYESIEFRGALARDMTVLTDVLAKNIRAALAFQDENTAHEILQALQAEPHVVAACVYTPEGNRFAEYSRSPTHEFPAGPGGDGYHFERGRLALFRPIVLNEKRIGTIYLQADLKGMYDRLRLFAGIAALALIGSLAVALILSSRLQRPISGPILALAATARIIAEKKDYTVRAPEQGRNETGLLTEAFNQMLAGIEERENALRQEIAERKGAEARAQSQLARLELLNQITRATSERQDLKSIFQVVIGTLEEQLPLDFACVCIYDQASYTLTVTSVGTGSMMLASELALMEEAPLAIDQNGLSQCVIGQLVYEPDLRDSPYPFSQRLVRGGLASLVAAPLVVESKVFGVLIGVRRQPRSFSSGECEFLKQLSEHVALAAHQAQLYIALQQAYDDLRQTQQAVMQQERLRALGQMASGIAHDINNSISPVMLYTESLLEREPNLSERTRNYLGTIQRAIEDVAQTVARMREFYRQREPQLLFAPVQLNLLVGQVLDLSRVRWSDMPLQRGIVIKMTTELASDLPTVMGIESEIREMFVNLIFNAVDAMPEGGTLSIRTKMIESTETITSQRARRNVGVEISDTGVGMSEDTRRRCLEPFFTTKGERGTGLGLAMVYGTVQRHGAEIEIESDVDRGTTFRLIFPVPAISSAEPTTAEAALSLPTRARILVVDDDPLLIKSLRDTLEADGHIVTTASGGQAGIDAFRAALERGEPFAVTITDLGMPYVDGRKVASALKAASPSVPVILLTGWGQRLMAEGDVPPHVDCVLSKPPKLRELREALTQCLRSQGSGT